MNTWTQFECLHPAVIATLTSNGFTKPTPIQSELFSCYPHYYDFLVAAQTGSGKTLAFAAPILSELQTHQERFGLPHLPPCLLALVLTPTRELAQQIEVIISMALGKINEGKDVRQQAKVACIIGGMSKEKQIRILRQRKPHIIIGTPGRLHELLGEKVLDFSRLKYLVVDQADRMVEMGHFKQIDLILQTIFEPKKEEYFDKDFEAANQMMQERAGLSNSQFFVKEKGQKVKVSLNLNSLPTDQLFEVPSSMFIFDQPEIKSKDGKTTEVVGKKEEKQIQKLDLSAKEQAFLSTLKRRVFFVSATLTREFKGTKYFIKKPRTQEEWKEKRLQRKEKRKERQKEPYNKKKGQQQKNVQETPQESIPKLKALISRARFSDKPKIIDLSLLLFLPEGLTQMVAFIETDNQRTSLIVNYLQGLPVESKTIIFANTIKACKRIQFFLQSFGVETVNLHSHMQQRQRIKKLQKFKKSTLCNVLIATDVAARGLDFHVTHIIQMGVPVNGDTYVHRAGRTARANRRGEALILVNKKEANRWTEINDIIEQASPNRKVGKYRPTERDFAQIEEKVEQFDWIRRNQQRQETRGQIHDEMDAQQLGVGIDEEVVRKKYDLDKEEENIVRQEVKKRAASIRSDCQKKKVNQTQQQKWKKNKLVLSLDQIHKML